MVEPKKTINKSYRDTMRIMERRRLHEKYLNDLDLTAEQYALLEEMVHEERGKE